MLKSLSFIDIPLYWGTSNVNIGNSFIEIKSLISGLRHIISFFVFGLVYGYILGLNIIRNSLLAVAFVIIPSACLLLGIHIMARIELLTGYGVFDIVSQNILGWSFIIFGLLSSIFIGVQLKRSYHGRYPHDAFSSQLGYEKIDTNWLMLTAIMASLLGATAWFGGVINGSNELAIDKSSIFSYFMKTSSENVTT